MNKDFIKLFEFSYLKDENEINYSESSINGEDYINIVNDLNSHSNTDDNKILQYKYSMINKVEHTETIPIDNGRCIDLRSIGEYGCIPALINKYKYTFGDTEFDFTIERGDNDILIKRKNYVYLENKNSDIKYSIYYFSNYKEKYSSLLAPGLLIYNENNDGKPSVELYTLNDNDTKVCQKTVSIPYHDLINYDIDKIIESANNDANCKFNTDEKDKSLDSESSVNYSFQHYDNYYITNKTYTMPFVIGINGLYIPSHDHILNMIESVVRKIDTKEIVKIVKTCYLKADSNKLFAPVKDKSMVTMENKNDIEKIKLGDSINLELTGDDSGTFSFKCVYDDEDVKYLLCQTAIKDNVQYKESFGTWYTSSGNRFYSLKIPTYDQIKSVSIEYRNIGYDYWISTNIPREGSMLIYANEISIYVNDSGEVETCLTDKYVAALLPLLVYKKEHIESDNDNKEIDTDNITKNDITKLIVNDTIYLDLTGSNIGKYKFKCIYKDNCDVYLLCQDNLGNGLWKSQSAKSWYTIIDNKVYTLKIPTYQEIMYLNIKYKVKATGFNYWIGRKYYYIDQNGVLSQSLIEYDKYGTAPILIYKLSDTEDDNKNNINKHIVDKEVELITELNNAYDKFSNLPDQDQLDKEEFSKAIDQCKKILYLRIIKLAEPDLYYLNNNIKK